MSNKCPKCGDLQWTETYVPHRFGQSTRYRVFVRREDGGSRTLGYTDKLEMARAMACGTKDAIIAIRADLVPNDRPSNP
jgi:rRNA maturation protein Nop10